MKGNRGSTHFWSVISEHLTATECTSLLALNEATAFLCQISKVIPSPLCLDLLEKENPVPGTKIHLLMSFQSILLVFHSLYFDDVRRLL
jgi:hypothetical protein